MYHKKLVIVIFGRNLHMADLIRDMTPLPQFEHEIVITPEFDPKLLKSVDIVILELPQPVTPAQVRTHCGENTHIILCMEGCGTSDLDDASLAASDLFWGDPLDDRLVIRQFRSLLEQIKSEHDGRLNQLLLDTLLDIIPDMVWFKDMEGSHVKVNDAFCHIVGKKKDDVTGKDHCYIWDISKEEFERGEFVCKETDEYVICNRAKCSSAETVKSQQGMRQFNTYKAPLIYEGAVLGSVGVGHDVTDLENMGAELEIILRSMPFAILVWNEDGIIINANDKFEEYFGTKRKEVIGRPVRDWEPQALQNVIETNHDGYIEATVRGHEPDKSRTLVINKESIYDVFHNEVGGLCIYRDVTMERAMEEQILRNSNTDFLTGLNNRRYFYQYVRENRGDRKTNLLYVDLDQFKKINDTYGHQVGDEALIITATLLRECFSNEFIARIGGDEFLVVMFGEYSKSDLEKKASHLLERMKQVFSSMKNLKELSASIGIAQADDPEKDIDLLIRQSDTALYEAKLDGRARYCFYSKD